MELFVLMEMFEDGGVPLSANWYTHNLVYLTTHQHRYNEKTIQSDSEKWMLFFLRQ